MLSSIRSKRLFILASVKFLSRALTALNFDPSIATLASLNRSSFRHGAVNSRQISRMGLPLSLRKSAMVLKSGASCPVSQIISMLRWHPGGRLDGIRPNGYNPVGYIQYSPGGYIIVFLQSRDLSDQLTA